MSFGFSQLAGSSRVHADGFAMQIRDRAALGDELVGLVPDLGVQTVDQNASGAAAKAIPGIC